MRTIKIFLASSEELENDRNAFGNLIRRLDNIYEKQGIRIELFEWEDYDSAYNDRRKQDEYNDKVRASDMFLALFYKKAGKYTIEEWLQRSSVARARAPKAMCIAVTCNKVRKRVSNSRNSRSAFLRKWATIGVATTTKIQCNCIL